MGHHSAAPVGATVVIYVVVVAILIFRFARPQRMTVTRMWVMPILFFVLTGFSVWSTYATAAVTGIVPPPVWQVVVAILLGIIVGIPLGIFRGRHTSVRATDQPGVMYLESSWITMSIWIGAFLIRAGLRYVAAGRSQSLAEAVGDGLVVFAVAAVIASYFVIYEKYRAQETERFAP
ncbi:MAG: DUF1453 family protein [Candidatus Eremiobacteraeota bacterium]|nr:DUF1453 family protein [Candidatus Eremiobacteraeota bacterium]